MSQFFLKLNTAFNEHFLVRRLTNGVAVRLTGKFVPSLGSGQSHELLVDEESGGQVEIVGECDSEVPSSLSVNNNRDAKSTNCSHIPFKKKL